MKNILPRVSDKVANVEKSKLSYWNPSDSDPATAKISNCLTTVFSVDVEKLLKYRENVLPKSAPNYVSPYTQAQIGPSPLDKIARGIPDDVIIDIRNAKFENERPKSMTRKLKSVELGSHRLVIHIYSTMPVNQDLFIQTQATISSKILQPYTEFTRCLLYLITQSFSFS